MAPDRASAEVAQGFRAVCEIMTQKVQLSYKKDIETRAFKKREQDYNVKMTGAKQFPAVKELYAKYNKHHKEIVEPIDKKLAELTTEYQNVTESFAEALVKALPINDIKTRQVIEAAKGELSREDNPSQPAQDDRLQKLEELVNSLKEKHEAQDCELTKLKKLNDKLRAGESKTETLEKEREQLRSENLSLNTRLDALTKRLESVEAWKAVFPKDVELQWTQYSKSLEEAKVEWNTNTTQINSNAVQDETTREHIVALGHKSDALGAEIAAVRKDVDGHEQLLANVDIENLDDTIAKVLDYPTYSALNDRITSQQAVFESLKDTLHSTKQGLEKDIAQRIKGFSDKIIEYCARKFDDFETRVKILQAARADSSADVNPSTRAHPSQTGTSNSESTPASGPNSALDFEGVLSRLDAAESHLTTEKSRADATESNVNTLQTKTEALRSDLDSIKDQMLDRCAALDMMVETLNEQWKNMNTTQMAQYMLEHLSRLQPSQLTPELRQFHMRLADVEKLVRDEKQERQALRDRVRSSYDDIGDHGKKRVFAESETFQSLKHARIEGLNSLNGVANGHPHP
ncbi:hypothetical protein VP1G_07130 [Cytospora mali]|uniref:Uncharacterized protein n=1 Tax=Cytospora mali TaxID=578113 RepID=A0A194V7L7_CYTMA|nr:hypothetical protein VP1G_07130 [Valsa mali var. pyri (nom. inval.)]